MEQAGGCEGSGSLEIQKAGRKAAHYLWLSGFDPAADGRSSLLRAGSAEEWRGYESFLPPVYGSRNVALQWRHWSRPPRSHDGNDQLGGERRRAILNHGEP